MLLIHKINLCLVHHSRNPLLNLRLMYLEQLPSIKLTKKMNSLNQNKGYQVVFLEVRINLHKIFSLIQRFKQKINLKRNRKVKVVDYLDHNSLLIQVCLVLRKFLWGIKKKMINLNYSLNSNSKQDSNQ